MGYWKEAFWPLCALSTPLPGCRGVKALAHRRPIDEFNSYDGLTRQANDESLRPVCKD